MLNTLVGKLMMGGIALIVALTGAVLLFLKSKRPWFWIGLILLVACVLFIIFGLPRFVEPTTLLSPKLPGLFRNSWYWTWLLVCLVLAIVALVDAVRRIRRGGAVQSGTEATAELDEAWDELLRELDRADIDLSARRVYLMLAPRESDAAELASATGIPFFAQAPLDPSKPIHAYATEDGVLLSCAGACHFGLIQEEAATPKGDAESEATAGPDRSAEVLLNRLCQLIRSQQPDCPILRGIVCVFPIDWARSRASVEQARAIREDLRILRQQFKLQLPTFAVFSGMEVLPGFGELVGRMPPEYLMRRCGFAVPAVRGFDREVMERGLVWVSDWFQSWITVLMASDPEASLGNGDLFCLGHETRRFRNRLQQITEAAFTVPRGEDPIMLRGCYFAATDAQGGTRAFANGLFAGAASRIIADHRATLWSEQAERDDQQYSRLALALGIVAVTLAVGLWLVVLSGYSLTLLGLIGLGATALTWIIGTIMIINRGR